MSDELFRAGFDIPDKTNIRWDSPKSVKHFLIDLDDQGKIESAKTDLSIRFLSNIRIFKKDVTDTSIKKQELNEVELYVKHLVTSGNNPTSTSRPQPLNVALDDQSWVILQLSDNVEWQFSTTHPALTTKSPDKVFWVDGRKKHGFNANLRYVDDVGNSVPYEDVELDKTYRMIFFRVLLAEKGVPRGMNIFVDLFAKYEDDQGSGRRPDGRRRIPLIIDPDVPDDGNQGFPAPPAVPR